MLRIEGLHVAYGERTAVHDLTLEVHRGEIVCVLGPSGCGKSTLLRAIAGLESPGAGTISLNGRSLVGLRPDQRHVSMMFQDHALFPHRNVHDNVAFGLRMRGASNDEIRARVTETLALVDLVGFGPRPVTELSGGERQRVALARAIAPQPQLLMLDEPLGSLDRALQTRLLDEFPQVFAALDTTVLYVTHDQHEALTLADRIAVMRDGQFEQVATPDTLWRAPRNAFVAGFLGLEDVFNLDVHGGVATTPWGSLSPSGIEDGRHEAVLLAGALRLVDAGTTPVGRGQLYLEATVISRRFAGDHHLLRVQPVTGPQLAVPIWRGELPRVNDHVTIALDTASIHVLERRALSPGSG